MVDFSRLKIPIKAYDNCTIIDISSGAFPRYIEVRMPGKDGARRTAVWDGSLNLANNDKVMCHEYPGNPILRIVSFGGDQAAGTDGVKVSKVWEPDGSATTLVADNSGDNTISGHVILSGVSKAIKGSGSNVPDLGTSTAAERFGNLYLADTKTIDNPGTLNIDATTAQVFKIATTEKMRLVSGGLGIGTATVPHGAVGAALLALDGPNASTSGPHIQFTTASDDYPLFQLLNWTHDNIEWLFDAYYPGGANYLSSYASSNFSLIKNAGQLTWRGEWGIAQGAAITWDNLIQISQTDIVINEGGLDRNLRAEGVGDANLLVIDASTARIGVRNASPQKLFHIGAGGDAPVTATDGLYVSNAGNTALIVRDSTNDVEGFLFAGADGNFYHGTSTNHTLILQTNNVSAIFIDVNQRVGISVTPVLAKVHVDQASTTAAIPVLYLDQADLSEEMIEFNSTIGIGNAIEAAGAKVLTTTHFIKVTIPGGLTRYFPVGTIA